MRQRLLDRAGLGESKKPKFTIKQARKLFESERLDGFYSLMCNRLVMGALRYGPLAGAHHAKHGFRADLNKEKREREGYPLPKMPGSVRVQSAINRLFKYQETGNREHLVDAANMCGIEFEFGNHPRGHFEAIDRKD
jgi:hypothetical protein